MDASEARQKHYMRVLLVLQGLMDRTKIFRPMPTDHINLSDPKHCFEWLNLIYESENIITDGNPNFNEWQKEINQELDVGCRIIGIFDYSSRIRGDREGYETSRIYPANADFPTTGLLHTLEEREGRKGDERFVFRYDRTEKIYVRKRWGRDPVGGFAFDDLDHLLQRTRNPLAVVWARAGKVLQQRLAFIHLADGEHQCRIQKPISAGGWRVVRGES